MPIPHPVAKDSSYTLALQRQSLLTFFFLVFALSIPFGIGAVTRVQLSPGLLLSALLVVCPALAASILVYREKRIAGVIELLKRSFDYKGIRTKIWHPPIILLMLPQRS